MGHTFASHCFPLSWRSGVGPITAHQGGRARQFSALCNDTGDVKSWNWRDTNHETGAKAFHLSSEDRRYDVRAERADSGRRNAGQVRLRMPVSSGESAPSPNDYRHSRGRAMDTRERAASTSVTGARSR